MYLQSGPDYPSKTTSYPRVTGNFSTSFEPPGRDERQQAFSRNPAEDLLNLVLYLI